MLRSEFAYELPPELIARYPTPRRGDSRLLHLRGATGTVRDLEFRQLPQLLHEGDLLVFNDTRVVPARVFGHKDSGGRVEILLERLLDARLALVQLRASKPPRLGAELTLDGGVKVRVAGRRDEFWELAFDEDAGPVFERAGEMPLPPYLGRPAEPMDRERYQTVYARLPGAVAAPTAGLHFTGELLAECARIGVRSTFLTLQVGAGTFQNVRVQDLSRHQMHAELTCVPPPACAAIEEARAIGGRVVAVGTTSVRALETAAADGTLRPFQGDTRLFIRPGYRFRVIDALITNFHLPESTLLMLVCAFAGRTKVLDAYRHAIEQRYRFFSYGDAMFVEPAT